MSLVELTDQDFSYFQQMIHNVAGISMPASKKTLVVSRLSKRLREYQVNSFSEYLKLLRSNEYPHELQTVIDLLTTNETYFFREPKHWHFLREHLSKLDHQSKPFRIWSAACSSGQEPYSIAMMLEDLLGPRPWEVMASDLSTRMLAKATQGLYPISEAESIPKHYLKNFCLKGVGSQSGSFLIARSLREKIRFFQCNLNTAVPNIGEFDVIFLRNVMIYFDADTKRQVVKRLFNVLKPGGYFLIGHSEGLNGINDDLRMIAPAIFHKKE